MKKVTHRSQKSIVNKTWNGLPKKIIARFVRIIILCLLEYLLVTVRKIIDDLQKYGS